MIDAYVRRRLPIAPRHADSWDPLAFHRTLRGYARTPLRRLDGLAHDLGIGELLVKDESSRLGLPSFKILGASWAIRCALGERIGIALEELITFAELRERVQALRPLSLVSATDGNHGRAVARMAQMLGLDSLILVPQGTAGARVHAIEAEGAVVEVVPGGYDDAVRWSAELAGRRCVVISDTSWPGYEDVPRWVIDGYSTILCEVDDQLAEASLPVPDIVIVQMGVGAFAAAVARHAFGAGNHVTVTVGVEPVSAACVLRSLCAGRITTLTEPQDSIMAGLNCGTPSLVAWPELSEHLDVALAISDERARQAMRALARSGVVAGESGAAGIGGLLELLSEDELEPLRHTLKLGAETRILVFCTEGATDAAAYDDIVGAVASEVSNAVTAGRARQSEINA